MVGYWIAKSKRLCNKIAKSKRSCIKNLYKIINKGKEIVAKLKGLSSCKRVVGHLLYFKNTKMDWSSFKDNELDSILQQENQIQPILKISLNHLPLNLK